MHRTSQMSPVKKFSLNFFVQRLQGSQDLKEATVLLFKEILKLGDHEDFHPASAIVQYRKS